MSTWETYLAYKAVAVQCFWVPERGFLWFYNKDLLLLLWAFRELFCAVPDSKIFSLVNSHSLFLGVYSKPTVTPTVMPWSPTAAGTPKSNRVPTATSMLCLSSCIIKTWDYVLGATKSFLFSGGIARKAVTAIVLQEGTAFSTTKSAGQLPMTGTEQSLSIPVLLLSNH